MLVLRRIGAMFAALALIMAPLMAQAARVSPMIVELKPTGSASVSRVELTNESDRDIPFEVRLMRGEIAEDGDLKLTPADEEFLVFPAQTIVQAKSQQVFRLQYVGAPDLAQSEIYYMSVRQVPVAFDKTQSQVQVVVNYNVLVNVVPDGAKPVAVVETADSASRTDEDNKIIEGVNVRVSNSGNRYFFAGTSDWSIIGTTKDGKPYAANFKDQDMTKIVGFGVVAPGRTREFFVPTEVALAPGTVHVEVSP